MQVEFVRGTYSRSFTDIKDLSFAPTFDPMSDTLPYNDFTVTLVTTHQIPIGARALLYDSMGNLWAKYWVMQVERVGDGTAVVSCQSTLKHLERNMLTPRMLTSGTSAETMIRQILNSVLSTDDYTLTLPDDTNRMTVKGYFPEQSARNRLQWLCLTCGLMLREDYGGKVEIIPMEYGEPRLVPLQDTYWRPAVHQLEYYTGARVYYYEFEQDSSGHLEVDGQKYNQYEHQITVRNHLAPSIVLEKYNTVQNVTCITEENVDDVLSRRAQHFFRESYVDADVIDNYSYRTGDRVYVTVNDTVMAEGIITSASFAFGLQTKATLKLEGVITYEAAKLTVTYEYEGLTVAHKEYMFPVGYEYDFETEFVDVWILDERFVFRPLTKRLVGVMPTNGTDLTVQVAVALRQTDDVLRVISVDYATEDSDGITLILSGIGGATMSDAQLGTRNINRNGTYRAIADGYDGYSSVTVSVPSEVGAESEGMVVVEGELVSQRDITVTQNGTYNTVDVKQVAVNVASSDLFTFGIRNIVENGTYDASSDNFDGYSSVTVNVPNGVPRGGAAVPTFLNYSTQNDILFNKYYAPDGLINIHGGTPDMTGQQVDAFASTVTLAHSNGVTLESQSKNGNAVDLALTASGDNASPAGFNIALANLTAGQTYTVAFTLTFTGTFRSANVNYGVAVTPEMQTDYSSEYVWFRNIPRSSSAVDCYFVFSQESGTSAYLSVSLSAIEHQAFVTIDIVDMVVRAGGEVDGLQTRARRSDCKTNLLGTNTINYTDSYMSFVYDDAATLTDNRSDVTIYAIVKQVDADSTMENTAISLAVDDGGSVEGQSVRICAYSDVWCAANTSPAASADLIPAGAYTTDNYSVLTIAIDSANKKAYFYANGTRFTELAYDVVSRDVRFNGVVTTGYGYFQYLYIGIVNSFESWATITSNHREMLDFLDEARILRPTQASESTLGTKTIAANGTYSAMDYDLDGFSQVTVNVPSASLGTKSITSNGTYAASGDSLDGYSAVTVNVPSQSANLGTKSITANGTYQASGDSFDGYSAVTVNVPSQSANLGTKTIIADGTYSASADGLDGYSSVTVNSVGSLTLGAKNITSNGTYTAAADSLDGFHTVTADIHQHTVTVLTPHVDFRIKDSSGTVIADTFSDDISNTYVVRKDILLQDGRTGVYALEMWSGDPENQGTLVKTYDFILSPLSPNPVISHMTRYIFSCGNFEEITAVKKVGSGSWESATDYTQRVIGGAFTMLLDPTEEFQYVMYSEAFEAEGMTSYQVVYAVDGNFYISSVDVSGHTGRHHMQFEIYTGIPNSPTNTKIVVYANMIRNSDGMLAGMGKTVLSTTDAVSTHVLQLFSF